MENKVLLMLAFGIVFLFIMGIASGIINFDKVIKQNSNEKVSFQDSKLKQDMEAKGVIFPETIMVVGITKIGDSDGS